MRCILAASLRHASQSEASDCRLASVNSSNLNVALQRLLAKKRESATRLWIDDHRFHPLRHGSFKLEGVSDEIAVTLCSARRLPLLDQGLQAGKQQQGSRNENNRHLR